MHTMSPEELHRYFGERAGRIDSCTVTDRGTGVRILNLTVKGGPRHNFGPGGEVDTEVVTVVVRALEPGPGYSVVATVAFPLLPYRSMTTLVNQPMGPDQVPTGDLEEACAYALQRTVDALLLHRRTGGSPSRAGMEEAIRAALATYDPSCMRLARTLGYALRHLEPRGPAGTFKLSPLYDEGDFRVVWVAFHTGPEEDRVAIDEGPHRWSGGSLPGLKRWPAGGSGFVSDVWGGEVASPLRMVLREPDPSRIQVTYERGRLFDVMRRHRADAMRLHELLARFLAASDQAASGELSVRMVRTEIGPTALEVVDHGERRSFGPRFAHLVDQYRRSLVDEASTEPSPRSGPRVGRRRLRRLVLGSVALGLLAALSSFPWSW